MMNSSSARIALMAFALAAANAVSRAGEEEGEGRALRLGVADCIRMAIGNSGEVRSAELDVQVADGHVMEARSAALPQIEASAGYSQQSGFGSMLPGFDPSAFGLDLDEYYTASLTLNQVIYQAEVRYGLKAASIAVLQAKTARSLARTGIAYGVRATYAAVLLREAFAAAAAESVDLASKHLADVQAKRRAGIVTDFEVLQARVQLRSAKAQSIKARSGVELGRAKLLRVVGLDQGLEIELTGRLTYEPVEPPLLGGLLAVAVGTAEGDEDGKRPAARVELRVMDLAVDLQRIALAVATAGRKPSVYLQGGYSGAGFEDWLHEDFSFDWQLGLMLRVPVFDGFRASGKRRQEEARLAQLLLKRQSLAYDIEYDIRSALSRVDVARGLVESQTGSVALAEEAVRQARVRYENGFVIELVVEQARLGFAQARTGLAQAKFDHLMATLDLEKAAGTLEVPPPAEEAAPEPAQ